MTAASKPVHVRPLDRQNAIDGFREARIQELQDDLNAAPDYAAARSIWAMLRAEINARSKQEVLRMERERGLM